ncbi:MAG: thioredoxin family protein [Halothermotrichaceae bacterium]
MKIKIYGGGCANCKKLAENTEKAADELGVDIDLLKVEDYAEIAKAGIMTTPALAVEDEVKFKGQVASVEEIKKVLRD